MRHYILTTTKFAEECITYLTYGSTQSNWLANIDAGDMIFLSQFNYKSQDLFGPFRVTKTLFYDKTIIYPQQKYFFRIQYNSIGAIKKITETDLYLNGIKSGNIAAYFQIINLIQQNKHLHCICLTKDEGETILNTFLKIGIEYGNNLKRSIQGNLKNTSSDIDCEYIYNKNKLDKKCYFSSESDLETYIIFSTKITKSDEYKNVNKLLNKYPNNGLQYSEIYNQFIFGNAYPSDIVILNKENINIFELKKDKLSNSNIAQIEKEIEKHLYYSLFSNRVKSNTGINRFNFYLTYLKDNASEQFEQSIIKKYKYLCNKIISLRENTITFVEYEVKDKILLLKEKNP